MRIDGNINLLLPDELLILSTFDFMTEPKDIPKPKYNHPPVVFMIQYALIGNNMYLNVIIHSLEILL